MGNYFKIIPEPPYRKENINKAIKNDLFVFDSMYAFKDGDYTYVYGVVNKPITLPMNVKIIDDLKGTIQYKKIGLCYDLRGNILQYIIPNSVVILSIENLNDLAYKYGCTMLEENRIWLFA